METEIKKLTESLINEEKTSIKCAKYIGGLKGLQKFNSNNKKTNWGFLVNCIITLREHDRYMKSLLRSTRRTLLLN